MLPQQTCSRQQRCALCVCASLRWGRVKAASLLCEVSRICTRCSCRRLSLLVQPRRAVHGLLLQLRTVWRACPTCHVVPLPASLARCALCVGPLHALPGAQQRARVCRPSWRTGCTIRRSTSPSRSECRSLSRPPSTPPPTCVPRCAVGARRVCCCPAVAFVKHTLRAEHGPIISACGVTVATNVRPLRGSQPACVSDRTVGKPVPLSWGRWCVLGNS